MSRAKNEKEIVVNFVLVNLGQIFSVNVIFLQENHSFAKNLPVSGFVVAVV